MVMKGVGTHTLKVTSRPKVSSEVFGDVQTSFCLLQNLVDQ